MFCLNYVGGYDNCDVNRLGPNVTKFFSYDVFTISVSLPVVFSPVINSMEHHE